MKLRSHIDFPGFLFRQYNPHGELNVAATVSALFDIVDGINLSPSAEQRDIQLVDEFSIFDGETDILLRQADFVPFKTSTDVTALAISSSPGAQARPSWQAGIGIDGYEKVLNVHGPRNWQHIRKHGWHLSQSEPVASVPIDYVRAFGGPIITDGVETGDVHQFNPLGPGVLSEKQSNTDLLFAAPQIEDQRAPIADPFRDYLPEGLAPIHPAWAFRRRFAGSYDETWLETQHPFLPPDFDYRFYNCAHPTLSFGPFLSGAETVRVANLHHIFAQMSFTLPGLAFGAVATYRDKSTVRSHMALDGVHLELLEDMPRLRLTWRAAFPWKSGIRTIDLGKVPPEGRKA